LRYGWRSLETSCSEPDLRLALEENAPTDRYFVGTESSLLEDQIVQLERRLPKP
jgi:hypothetical protein